MAIDVKNKNPTLSEIKNHLFEKCNKVHTKCRYCNESLLRLDQNSADQHECKQILREEIKYLNRIN